MFLRSQTPIISEGLAAAMLGALPARPAGALLTTPTVRLFENPLTVIDPAGDNTQFTECTFTGYTAQAIASWVGPVDLGSARQGIHSEVDFAAGTPVTAPGVAYGYYINDGSTGDWQIAEIFASPVPFATPGQFLSLDVVVPQAERLDATGT